MQVRCCDEAANPRLPIAVAFWIIQIISAEECSSLMKNLMQIHCSTHSVVLNAMATQYTCSLNCVYCPHWLVQWSHHCSGMHSPVHCPWLPGYITTRQTSLTTVTMVGLSLDRPHKRLSDFTYIQHIFQKRHVRNIFFFPSALEQSRFLS